MATRHTPPLDWHYLGPPDANRRSPYWPAGTPWGLRENFEEFATLLDPAALRAAADRSPYKAIPLKLTTSTYGTPFDVLPIFDLFCSTHGIPRSDAHPPRDPAPLRARYLAALPAIHRHPPALHALLKPKEPSSPRGSAVPQTQAAVEAWKNVAPAITAAAWDTYELDALAFALTLPDSTHLANLAAACNGAPPPHPSILLP